MFDAYTVKKVLPRLVIAAILIQLSWPLFTLFISLVSNIAWGIEGLLYSPFGGRDQLEIGQILEGAAGGGTFTLAAALTGVGAVGGVIALGGAGLLSLGLTILLALMIGFFVLAIRQVVIVVLLVTAPIALVAWILPGTEKVWKLWWESFSKALFMYPLILLLIAGGRIAAKIAAGNPDASGDGSINLGNDPFQFAIVLLAFFGPFFLIPKTFQVAGSAFANIAGIANNRSRGVFDRLSKGRQARAADRFKRAQDNHLWNPNSRIGSRANTLASWATDPWKNTQAALGTKKGEALKSQIAMSRFKETEALAGEISKMGMNDRALRQLSNWDGSEKDLQNRIKYLKELGATTGDANDTLGAQQLEANARALYATHQSEEFGRGSINGAAGLALASQGFIRPDEIATLSNRLDSGDAAMGSPGMGAMFKTSAELLGKKAGALTNPGYSVMFDEESNQWVSEDPESDRSVAMVRKTGVADIGSAKGLSMKEGSNKVGRSFVKALTSGTDQERRTVKDTLVTAYNSYTNPTIKKDIELIMAEEQKILNPGISDADAEQRAVAELRRGRSIREDEMGGPAETPPDFPELGGRVG